MSEHQGLTRESANRRLAAVTAWCALFVAAAFLTRGRLAGVTPASVNGATAVLLSAYGAFVAVFAWMLYNPDRRSPSESPMLFLASAATLGPPPVIGFCLMPADSGLRAWLAFGVLLLVIIAVLSPVPEGFFSIPRSRLSYLQLAPVLDIADGTVDAFDPNWLQYTDLSEVVADAERPSLAPRAYLQQDRIAARTRRGRDSRRQSEPTDVSVLPAKKSTAKKSTAKNSTAETWTAENSTAETRTGGSSTGEKESSDRIESTAPPQSISLLEKPAEQERFLDESGTELVEGTLTVRFDRGQKRAHLHVAFSPPLPGVPDVECEPVGDVPLRLKIPVRQSYGIRIDVRRTQAAEPLETEIAYSAIYSPE